MGGSILLVAILAIGAPQVQVSTVDGEVIKGDLKKLSSEGITLNTVDGEASYPFKQVLAVAPSRPPSKPDVTESPTAWIELVDGSRLTANRFTVEDDSAEIDLGPNHQARVPTAMIRSVRFSRPDDPASPSWPANVTAEASADLLVIRKKDSIDYLEGRIGHVTDNRVILRADGVDYPTNRTKVDGLIYYHKTTSDLSDPLCTVEDSYGWKLRAINITTQWVYGSNGLPSGRNDDAASDGQMKALNADVNVWLRIMTLNGIECSIPWNNITHLDFSSGKIAYLSDLDPESVQWSPYLDLGKSAPALEQYYAPRRDEGREHEPLRLGGKTFAKGLSIYSRTQAVYRIPKGMKKFTAVAGIDDSVRPGGSVRLEISADGNKLLDRAIGGKDAPVEVNLDLAGARQLSILVDYGTDQDAGDYLDLADARMLK